MISDGEEERDARSRSTAGERSGNSFLTGCWEVEEGELVVGWRSDVCGASTSCDPSENLGARSGAYDLRWMADVSAATVHLLCTVRAGVEAVRSISDGGNKSIRWLRDKWAAAGDVAHPGRAKWRA